MEIRRLSMNDYSEMIRLWTKTGLSIKPRGRDSREAIAAAIVTTPEFFLGAFEDNHMIGVIILSHERGKGWINRLAIDPEYRNHGVAKALIAESERVLRKQGVKIFCALIEKSNNPSKELFKKCGYVEHHDIIYFSKRDNEET